LAARPLRSRALSAGRRARPPALRTLPVKRRPAPLDRRAVRADGDTASRDARAAALTAGARRGPHDPAGPNGTPGDGSWALRPCQQSSPVARAYTNC
jgi:hypothetical protein